MGNAQNLYWGDLEGDCAELEIARAFRVRDEIRENGERALASMGGVDFEKRAKGAPK
jgi:hypothetical protein